MARKKEVEPTVETIMVGDTAYTKDQLTPSVYFNYVKNMKVRLDIANFKNLRENCLALLRKTVITGQLAMAKKLTQRYEVILKEIKAIENGFDIVIHRSDLERFVADISNNPVRIIELDKYERDIPDNAIEKLMIAKEKELFDQYYIIFTDYTGKETKKIAKERHEKDPILFGAIIPNDDHNVPEERMFFIADWIDDNCDLTLNKLVEVWNKKSPNDAIASKYNIPTTVDELKKYMDSLGDKVTAKKNFTILSTVDDLDIIQ